MLVLKSNFLGEISKCDSGKHVQTRNLLEVPPPLFSALFSYGVKEERTKPRKDHQVMTNEKKYNQK